MSVLGTACGAGQLPPGTPIGDGTIHYKKVDLFVQEGGEAEDYDARLIFNPPGQQLQVTDEDNPRNVFASIPYDAITSITYSKSEHPRWKSGAGVAAAVGVFAIPIFFMKGKKHWMTLTFEGVQTNPEGALMLRLDKDNYTNIITTAEAQTGLEVERIIEE